MVDRRISVADTLVEYSSIGQGPCLVLVHGTSIDGPANFGHIVEQFSGQRTVIVPNYAGCGGSTIAEGALDLDVLVEQVAAVLRETPDGGADLLGDSLGAVVAAATAARYPALVRKLILVAGWADSSDPNQLVARPGGRRWISILNSAIRSPWPWPFSRLS
jgi:pimeloyl-ACP methyl ester carboxylesterase